MPIIIAKPLIGPVPHWFKIVPTPGKNMLKSSRRVAIEGELGLIVASHCSKNTINDLKLLSLIKI